MTLLSATFSFWSPSTTRQDDFVGRMLWALSHESGLPAKRFADFDPVPPMDWLEAFSDVMYHLARWLVRHLDDPVLILWLAQRGGQLHDRLVRLIGDKLDTFARLEREGNFDELARIRAQSPNAIPRPLLRPVWRLLLTHRVKSPWSNLEIYRWKDRLKRDGLTVTLRFELREADDRSDRSHWALPSISPHWQNRGFRDWVALIELVRDAWLALRENDPVRAMQVAQAWFAVPYSAFKRLALFAASCDGCITSDQWVDWLVADDAWWLWSIDTRRETLRLFVLRGLHLTPQARGRLEAAILVGPPRAMYLSVI